MSPQQPNITIDLCTLLYGGCDADGRPLGDPMLARRHLLRLGLGRSAADFLARAIWWWLRVGRRDFYKFNIPCDHMDYREGDSWCEELGFSWQTLRQARACVATKIGRGVSKKEVLASHQPTSLLLYWTRSDNRTWYELNEPLLCDLLTTALQVQVVMPGTPKAAPTPRVVQPPTPVRAGAAAILDDPRADVSNALPQQRYPQNGQSLSDDTQVASDKGRYGGDTPYSSIQQLKEEENDQDGQFIRLIALGLEGEGVFPTQAFTIARKAYQAGLDLDATLELFWEHQTHAAQSKRVRDPLAAATKRLLSGPLNPPPLSKGQAAAAEWRRRFFEETVETAESTISQGAGSGAASSTTTPQLVDPAPLLADPPCSHEMLPVQEGSLSTSSPEPLWWTGAKEILRWQMQRPIYDQLIEPATMQDTEDGTLLILVSNEGVAGRLQRWGKRIQKAVQVSGGGERKLVMGCA